MKLRHDVHLAYCTNVHRGEDWSQTFDSLERFTLEVKRKIAPDRPYAIGIRLSDTASRELINPATLDHFKKWLAKHDCYVFTINGFPFGKFHHARVKEQVYLPDWTSPDRLDYTTRLFDLLAQLLPDGIEGSVSTLPGSFKEFIKTDAQLRLIRENLWRAIDHIDALSRRTGKTFHLGLEPEPLGLFETSVETVDFFEQMRRDRPNDSRLSRCLGVNYDTCHLAVEFEEPRDAIRRFQENGIKISKLHLSSALKLAPTEAARQRLQEFADDVYLHQVVAKTSGTELLRFKDLAPALAEPPSSPASQAVEWRVHFHVPLHCPNIPPLDTTLDHLTGVLDLLKADPKLCSHLEMETYTWEVLPPELKKRSVTDQIVDEYRWTLDQLSQRGF